MINASLRLLAIATNIAEQTAGRGEPSPYFDLPGDYGRGGLGMDIPYAS